MSDSDLKKFDFQKPSGLSQDLIEQLRTWMNSFSNLFREKWSGIIASDIEIQYQSDTAYSFAVLKNRMPKPSVGYLIKFMDGGVDSMIAATNSLVNISKRAFSTVERFRSSGSENGSPVISITMETAVLLPRTIIESTPPSMNLMR